MISAHRLQWTVLAALVVVSTASAQGAPPQQPQTTPAPQTRSAPPGNMWSHGTTLNVFAGAAATAGDRAAVGGGALGWEIKPWIAIEGSGGWLDWGQTTHAFTAAMTTQVALLAARPVVPFVAAGIGLYHASFSGFDTPMPHLSPPHGVWPRPDDDIYGSGAGSGRRRQPVREPALDDQT